MDFKLINGDCLEELDRIEKNSIDSIVTDPPYELNFMDKGWDNTGVSFQANTWKKCFDVLEPGGYLLAFGGSRTFHRIAVAIEDAGFEIRDTIMWLYGSGFPKSMNIGLAIDKKIGEYEIKDVQNQYNGWGTQLKPSFEPIIVARKPLEGTYVDNVIKYGVGGLNIDECRVKHNEPVKLTNRKPLSGEVFNTNTVGFDNTKNKLASAATEGRFPANLILTYDQMTFDEVCGGFPDRNTPNGSITNSNLKNSLGNNGIYNKYSEKQPLCKGYNDSGSASRYFYCAKASKKDRDEGLEDFDTIKTGDLQGGRKEGSAGSIMLNVDGTTRINPYAGTGAPKKNIHPTVKPTELMQYLVRLVTPKNGIILDPFMGSGSTGKAVAYENKEREANYSFIGIEKEKEYCDIAEARIKFVEQK